MSRLGIVLAELSDYPSAAAAFDEAAQVAAAAGDARAAAYARLARHQVDRQVRPDV